jgi:hypothetical protein
MAITAEVTKNGKLVITCDLDTDGTPSASGKTMVHASTRGNITLPGVKVNGKALILGLNAYTGK